ncbi:ABC transporter permease [Mycobacterium spongiae]|uniref:FtsX-like permease family protein n=1 Tax=Mycobacterium spongiae TaxID=886343 RepID=A0A975K0L2_9MYCO|nr:FtsX-like permease family protein [Mycobacterium spongiae]QUR68750.1 FtsX-like permease family protein [Mycobacterium spongiae]
MNYLDSRAAASYLPLVRAASRRLRQRPFQFVLLVLGIALGVAMIVAIDLSSRSAQRAFDLSAQAVTGKATHRLVGGPAGIDQRLYIDLRRQGYDLSAPVIEGYVLARGVGNRPMRLMGIDPFAEPPFRLSLWSNHDVAELESFLTRPNAVVLSRSVAAEYGLALGDSFVLQVEGAPTTVALVGLATPPNEIGKQKLRDLIIADIATAQELFNMPGRLSHIDLIVKDQATAKRLKQRLPPGVRLEKANAQSDAVKHMTDAFTVNLTGLSLVALLVGAFLIYNTVTFNVVHRRPLFAVLRCLGVTRAQLFWLIMTESAIASVIGAGLGLAAGIWLGEGLIGLVAQTINDFYFVVNVHEMAISTESLSKGLIVGIGAAVLATVPPAIEATRTAPATTLRRSSLEGKVSRLMPWMWAASAAFGTFGLVMLWWPGGKLVMAIIGLFAVLTAFALITAPLTRFAMLRVAPALGRLFGPLGRMGPRDIARSSSRTSIAIAALMMAVSLIVGVSMSVGSLRQTLADWLAATLKADIYVSPPTLASGRPSGSLPPDAVETLSAWPGVLDAITASYGAVFAPTWGREVELMAVTGDMSAGKRSYQWIDGNSETLWGRFLAGEGVMLSEPMMTRQHLRTPPQPITLLTDFGLQTFPVLAVFSDYTSDQGVVLMDQASYRAQWHDKNVTTMFLFVAPDTNADALLDELRAEFAGREDLIIQSTRSVREASMAIFDRSFAITIALRLVATVVAFVAILSTLVSLELERSRELGVFRAIGMTPRQLGRLILLETGLMGGIAGLLALPTGIVLAWILGRTINLRSFGWTVQMHFEWEYVVRGVLVAVVAALAAGLYPAWRLSRMSISAAIREE